MDVALLSSIDFTLGLCSCYAPNCMQFLGPNVDVYYVHILKGMLASYYLLKYNESFIALMIHYGI